uniref:Chromosome 1 open reading frame 56 n=1 Tax=Catagonus wagneri TaxID=51154 RepID=A0A8C3YFU3_9CETA
MVPAADALLWALLLLSLGSRAAAGAQGLTSTATQRDSFRFGGPLTRTYRTTARSQSRIPPRVRITMEDEDDVVAVADRLAGPAAAELLASTVATGSKSIVGEEDESLEEGVVIYARKNDTSPETPITTSNTAGGPTPMFRANGQNPENQMSSSPSPSPWKAAVDRPASHKMLNQWSTGGSTPNRWPPPSPTAMPAPEDLQLVLMPWGPWHCHCKSGTMSRTRAGKLHGLSGRLRVGALSQLRTEHRPCTYHQCPCNRDREECPLDKGLCPDTSCTTTQTTTRATTTTTFPPLVARFRTTPLPSPNPALAFWKRVRIGLEDIWNSLSAVFTEMQPINRNQR